MAPTVFLMDYEMEQCPATNTIAVFSVGEFGALVADSLKTHAYIARHVHNPQLLDLSSTPLESFNILVSSASRIGHADILDGRSFSEGKIFIPITLVDLTLRIGPFVGRGSPVCWRCFNLRDRQAHDDAFLRFQRDAFYARYPEIEPRGFNLSLVTLAACFTLRGINRISSEVMLGKSFVIEASGRSLVKEGTIGIHACTRCGFKRSPGTRTWVDMHRAVREMQAEITN